MAKYVRQHFIPQFILKNFCLEKEKDKEELIYVYSNYELRIDKKRVIDAYMVKNLYDSTQFEDIKKLEKDLGIYLESKVASVINKLIKCENKFIINRNELKLIKKYLLIQLYRTEVNMTYYLNQNVKKVELSSSSIQKGESKLDFWKREIYTILHTSWDDLLKKDFPLHGVRHFALEIQQGHLCFFKTNDEFILNDLGKVSELIPVEIPSDKVEEFRKSAEFLSQIDLPQAKEIFEYELKNKTSKLETFSFYPVSPNFAIILARKYNLGISYINFYENSLIFSNEKFAPPINEYKNKEIYEINKKIINIKNNSDKIEVMKNIEQLYSIREKLFDIDDKYVYIIKNLSKEETISINLMLLNEARKFITFKTPCMIVDSVKKYNFLYNSSYGNIKNNFNGMLSLPIFNNEI